MPILRKSQQVEELLRQSIRTGEYAPGSAIPRERELAAMLGVSRTTVRDALRSLMNEGLLLRIQGSGTYVSKESAKGTIALVSELNYLTSKYGYTHKKLIIEERNNIEHDGYKAVLSVGAGETTEAFISSIRLLDDPDGSRVDGAIIDSGVMTLDSKLAQVGIPSVTISSEAAISKNAVVLDYDLLFQMAARAFALHGISDYVVMCPNYMVLRLYDKRDALLRKIERLLKNMVDGDESRILSVNRDNFDEARDVFEKWWTSPDCSKAIFFTDDALFDVCIKVIQELGLKSWDDIRVVTHFNVGRPADLAFPCIRIGFDLEEVASEAWRIMKEVIVDPSSSGIVKYIKPVVIDDREPALDDNRSKDVVLSW